VQGWKVPGLTEAVEIPQRLLAYLQAGTYLGAMLEDTELVRRYAIRGGAE
jgi:hypothetical protein